MTMFYVVYAGILGLLIGSFLNVVAIREPKRMFYAWKEQALDFLQEHHPEFLKENGTESIVNNDNSGGLVLDNQDNQDNKNKNNDAPPGVVKKSSHCVHCKTPLRWYHNLPVLSYLMLGGKCAFCKKPISLQYPAVELLMGILAASSVAVYGWSITGLAVAVFCAILLVLAVIDIKTLFLPDHIVLPSLWAALLWSAAAPYFGALAPTPTQAILGAGIGYLSLWSVFWAFKILTGKEGMGYGDFKLLALIGAFLGPSAILGTVLCSAVAGTVVGIILLSKKGESQPFPFGPYLAMGGILYALLSPLLPWMQIP